MLASSTQTISTFATPPASASPKVGTSLPSLPALVLSPSVWSRSQRGAAAIPTRRRRQPRLAPSPPHHAIGGAWDPRGRSRTRMPCLKDPNGSRDDGARAEDPAASGRLRPGPPQPHRQGAPSGRRLLARPASRSSPIADRCRGCWPWDPPWEPFSPSQLSAACRRRADFEWPGSSTAVHTFDCLWNIHGVAGFDWMRCQVYMEKRELTRGVMKAQKESNP